LGHWIVGGVSTKGKTRQNSVWFCLIANSHSRYFFVNYF
jgi:hypothetical protein